MKIFSTIIHKQFVLFISLNFVLIMSTALINADPSIPQKGTRTQGACYVPGDPIDANSCSYYFKIPLLNLGGPLPLKYTAFYHTGQQSGGALGYKFDHNIPYIRRTYSSFSGTNLYVRCFNEGDNRLAFKKIAGEWKVVDNSKILYQLQETGSSISNGCFYLMDPMEKLVYIFEKNTFGGGFDARLRWKIDCNGNQLTYSYIGDSKYPIQIDDGLGRQIDLIYTNITSDRVESVTDHAGRTVHFQYSNNLVHVITDAMGQPHRFYYSQKFTETQFIQRWEMPNGNAPYTNTYKWSRVKSQSDAYGNTMIIDYETPANATMNYPDGTVVIADHFYEDGIPKTVTDQLSNQYVFTQTTREQPASLTDREGNKTFFVYHEQTGKLSSVTNALGNAISYIYTSQNQTFTNPLNAAETVTFTFYNQTRKNYPDGTFDLSEYDSKGNIKNLTDAAGNQWWFIYNLKGQIQTITNPAGGVQTFTYTTNGMLATATDSDSGIGTTEYFYDNLFRLSSIQYPNNSSNCFEYDLNDQITKTTDGAGNSFLYFYDANGNLIKVTDPNGNSTVFVYDLMDRVVAITNSLGYVDTYSYDSLGRLSISTNQNNIATVLGYDPRGWPDSINYGGQTQLISYNAEGNIITNKTPMGFATKFLIDSLGHSTGVVDALNNIATMQSDSMVRPTAFSDALGRTTRNTYNSRGLINSVELPDGSIASYNWNNLGLLQQIIDLNSNKWLFDYSNSGRLKSITDPISNSWEFGYDQLGRRNEIIYPDSSTLAIAFDSAGNITNLNYSDGTHLQFTHDKLNNLLTANKISFERDEESQITNTIQNGLNFGTVYGPGGIVKKVKYNNGAVIISYTYNPTNGLLTKVTDSLTSAQIDFSYDNDFRLTGISRANNVDTSLKFDNASRLTNKFVSGPAGTIINLQFSYDAAGQITKLDYTAPLYPTNKLAPDENNFDFDNASRISSTPYAYNKLGQMTNAPGLAFQWDGASRLVKINDSILEYNGAGNLISKISNGESNRFFYNYGINLSPVVAEQNADSDAFLRYYVWTPGGRLLYMIDAADGNKVYYFHFDNAGSTLALTDSSGTVKDAYTYNPNGKLLKHTGNSKQPFTFIGEFGIRQENTNGIYNMRARYYDAFSARFISKEPIWPDLADPRQINPYQYALNNPVQFIDQTGLKPSCNESAQKLAFFRNCEKSFIGKNKIIYNKSDVKGVWSALEYKTLSHSLYRKKKMKIRENAPVLNDVWEWDNIQHHWEDKNAVNGPPAKKVRKTTNSKRLYSQSFLGNNKIIDEKSEVKGVVFIRNDELFFVTNGKIVDALGRKLVVDKRGKYYLIDKNKEDSVGYCSFDQLGITFDKVIK